MSTALAAPSKGGETMLFSVTAETVEPMAEKYLALRINGKDDKSGAEIVRRARLDCVKARTTCEKEHKAAKEVALKECQRIDKSRRDLLALIAPVEKHLEDQEKAVADELARIEQERQDAIYQDRVAKLAEHGCATSETHLRSMGPVQFAEFLAESIKAAVERKAEQDRLATEREQQRIEREKLKAERAELDKLRKAESERIAAQQAEIDRVKAEQEAEAARLRKIESDRIAAERAEQRRLADEQAAKERAAELERVAKEAEERARIETEARLKREAEETTQRERDEIAKRELEAAQRPDREKLLAFASVIEAVPIPAVSTAFESHVATIRQIIAVAVRQIRAAATAKSK